MKQDKNKHEPTPSPSSSIVGESFVYNGELHPSREATIGIDDLAFTYGFGVYETLKVRKGLAFFPELHAARLAKSAREIGLTHEYNEKQFVQGFELLASANKLQNANIKAMLVGGRTPQDSRFYAFASNPLFLEKKFYSQGVSTLTVECERPFVQAKAMSMISSYIAYGKARQAGAYDALLVDSKGNVREGTRSNLFYTDGETIYTPPAETVLEGVTKATLVPLLEKNEIRVEERALKLSELKNFDGYFLTNTSSKVIPVSKIDGNEFSIPDVTRKAVKLYDEFLEKYAQKRKDAGKQGARPPGQTQ